MHKKLENIKVAIEETNRLNDEQKDAALEAIALWMVSDDPFGVLRNQLFEIDEFFYELFAGLGLVEVI